MAGGAVAALVVVAAQSLVVEAGSLLLGVGTRRADMGTLPATWGTKASVGTLMVVRRIAAAEEGILLTLPGQSRAGRQDGLAAQADRMGAVWGLLSA